MNELISQARCSLIITLKDIRLYYLRAPVVMFGILIPLFLFLAFSVGRDLPRGFLLSGLIGIILFFGCTSVAPMVLPWESRTKTLERLISTPVLLESIIFGDLLASIIFGLGVATIPLLATAAFRVGIKLIPLLVSEIILAAFCFSSLGLLLSVPPSSTPSSIMMLSTLVKFPLIFISGIIIPLERMPVWERTLASISPLTYFVDLMRGTIQGIYYYSISFNIMLLLAFGIAFLATAIIGHRITLEKRL